MKAIVIAFLAGGLVSGQAAEKKNVMCTLPALKAIADEVAGSDFEVTALSKADQDPHFVDATPSLMKKLRDAALFIEIGVGMELWADEVANGSGNPKIMRGAASRLSAGEGISREEVPAVLTRAEGDVHAGGNPHLWLDPIRSRQIAENIARGLKRIDPAKADAIDERLKKFQDRIDEALFGTDLLKEVGSRSLVRKAQDGSLVSWLEEKKLAERLGGWMKRALPLRGQKVVEFHKTWIYPAKLFGFQIVGNVEPKPGINPTPNYLEALKGRIRIDKVRLILVENYQDASHPNRLAEEMGARAVVLPTQPAEGETYFSFMDRLIDRLSEAAK